MNPTQPTLAHQGQSGEPPLSIFGETAVPEFGSHPDWAEPFTVANATIHPHFEVLRRGEVLASDVCVGFSLHLHSPCGVEPLGIIKVSADHPDASVVDTLLEICQPSYLGAVRDPEHEGLHHEFVAHIVEHARGQGCRISSGWGITPHSIASGYAQDLMRTLNSLPAARSVTKRFYNPDSNAFETTTPEATKSDGGFEWVDIDLTLKGELRGIDNLRRAIRGLDAEKLKALGEGLEELAPHLKEAHIARLRLFSADPGEDPTVSREKVYCIFAGKTLITLRDGRSNIFQQGLQDPAVKKMLELAPSPAGLYVGLSEYCFERAESVVDSFDDRVLKPIMHRSSTEGQLRGAELRKLQTLVFTLEYIGSKFLDLSDALSGEKNPAIARARNGHAEQASDELARALPNHVQDIQNFVRRIDRAIAGAERLGRTSDSIAKSHTDGDILRLTLVAGASALATGGAAAAIVEFIPHWAQQTFFYGGFTAATLLLATAGVSWIRKRRNA